MLCNYELDSFIGVMLRHFQFSLLSFASKNDEDLDLKISLKNFLGLNFDLCKSKSKILSGQYYKKHALRLADLDA